MENEAQESPFANADTVWMLSPGPVLALAVFVIGALITFFWPTKYTSTAIILIETQLGKLLGSRSILNTLSTMAALSDAAVQDVLWNQLKNTPELTREVFEEKIEQKSAWAYRELIAYLRHSQTEGFDPTKVSGSFAGAMGIVAAPLAQADSITLVLFVVPAPASLALVKNPEPAAPAAELEPASELEAVAEEVASADEPEETFADYDEPSEEDPAGA